LLPALRPRPPERPSAAAARPARRIPTLPAGDRGAAADPSGDRGGGGDPPVGPLLGGGEPAPCLARAEALEGGCMSSLDLGPADVAARVERYHGVSLDAVMEVIAYLRDPGDSVIAGGSLALGLGNHRSDLDLVVCGEPTESTRVPLEHWVDSLRVDVWRRAQADIDELFERAESKLDDQAPLAGAFGALNEQTDLKLLHRIPFGIPRDGPQLRPATPRDYGRIARDLVVREYAERMRELGLVAQLATAAGDAIGATFNARLALEAALRGGMTGGGLPFSGDKWLRERLRDDLPGLRSVYAPFAVLPDL